MTWYSKNDASMFPLTAAGMIALAVMAWVLGRRLIEGQPPAGIVVLVGAMIFWIGSRFDSDVPLWPAMLLGAGGVGLILTWRE